MRLPDLRWLSLCLMLLCGSLAGSGWSAAQAANPVPAAAYAMTDDTGHTLHLNGPAQRVVPLYGAVTECLLAMGLSQRMVGRPAADAADTADAADAAVGTVGIAPAIKPPLSMYPPAAVAAVQALPGVGTHLRPDPESIAALRPDVVVQVVGRAESLTQVEALRRLGLPVLAFELHTVSDVLRLIRQLGALCGDEAAAVALCATLQARLDAVASRVAARTEQGLPLPRVVYEVRYPNLLVAGTASLVDDVIRRAGGVNAVSSAGRVVRLSEEALLGLNPDVYVYQRGPMSPNPLQPDQRPHFFVLRAVQGGRVLAVDERLFSRPGPRVVEAVEQLETWLWARNNAVEVLAKPRFLAEWDLDM